MKKKYKIAVLLAGNLRTFEETAPFLKKYLLDLYDSDVFIYTPNQIEHNEQAWHNITGKKHNSDDATRQELTAKRQHASTAPPHWSSAMIIKKSIPQGFGDTQEK